MPSVLVADAWIVMALGYRYSGVMKLASPSSRYGSVVSDVLEHAVPA